MEAERLDGIGHLRGLRQVAAGHAHDRGAHGCGERVRLRGLDPARTPGRQGRHDHRRLRGRRSLRPRPHHPRARSIAVERAICPGEARAAACTRPTPWRARRRRWACRFPVCRAPGSGPSPRRDRHASGAAVVELIRQGITTRDIIIARSRWRTRSRWSRLSAAPRTRCCTCGPSPIEAEVDLSMEDFHRIGSKLPLLADVKPFGRYVMSDVDRVGGCRWSCGALYDAGLINGDCADRHRQDGGREPGGHRLARPRRRHPPGDRYAAGHPRRHHDPGGSLAPEGAVCKSAGVPSLTSSRAPRGCSSASRRPWRRWRTEASRQATSWLSAGRAEGRPGHARDAG